MTYEELKNKIDDCRKNEVRLAKWSAEEIALKMLEKEPWEYIYLKAGAKKKRDKGVLRDMYLSNAYRIPLNLLTDVEFNLDDNESKDGSIQEGPTSKMIMIALKDGEVSETNLSKKIRRPLIATQSALARMRKKGLVQCRKEEYARWWRLDEGK